MNSGLKLGYILFGAGIGGFMATLYFEHELNKPIGEIEEYIPKSELNSKDNSDIDETLDDYKTTQIEDSFDNSIETTQKRRQEFEQYRIEGKNQTTRYSRMYADSNEEQNTMNKQITNSRHIITGKFNSNDIPNDDEPYEDDISEIDNDLVRERVENNFEIYLDENPQDFVSLIFYEGDNTLTDDREHVVPNAEDVVGQVALSRLIEGGPGSDNGVIFVRNLKTMINYEIVLDAGSYSETVLGILNSRRNKGAGGDVNR